MSFLRNLFGGGPVPAIGIDLGSTTIKLAFVNKAPDGFRISKLAVRPTPPAAVKDGAIADPALMAEEVRQMLAQSGLHVKEAVSAVSGQSVVMRTITMTAMTSRELKNSIKYEAERYIPYSVAEAQVDGAILRNPMPGDDQNMEVLLMAAPKSMVANTEEVIKASGLLVKAIELEPLSLLRLAGIVLSPEILKQTVALINIGASSTSINLFKEGVLRNSRTISLAGNNFTKAVAQGMNLSFEDAEKLKKEKGMIRIEKDTSPIPPTTMRIFNIILPVLNEFMTEIQRSFDFYRSRYKGESVDAIYLCGGTSRFKNLDQFLAAELGLPVQILNPIEKMGRGGVPGLSPEEAVELSQSLGVVLGLATWHLA